jgi:hypothetical protein
MAHMMVLGCGSDMRRSVGTNGGGIYNCFRGCSSRIGCVAFTFAGTADATTPATKGTGKC